MNTEQNTKNLLDFLLERKNNLGKYKKFAKVWARPAIVGEAIQTVVSGKNETGIRIAVVGEWVVSNIGAEGELMIIDDKTFRKRYDVDNGMAPLGASDGNKVYEPKNAYFYGIPYIGDEITFTPPNWGGTTMTIRSGYMLGGTSPDTLYKDFYGIEGEAFTNTYRQE